MSHTHSAFTFSLYTSRLLLGCLSVSKRPLNQTKQSFSVISAVAIRIKNLLGTHDDDDEDTKAETRNEERKFRQQILISRLFIHKHWGKMRTNGERSQRRTRTPLLSLFSQ